MTIGKSIAPVPVRETIEGIYGPGSVNYNANTGVITLTDPNTGRTGTINPSAYSWQNGKAVINPNSINSWLSPTTTNTKTTYNYSTPQQQLQQAQVQQPEIDFKQIVANQLASLLGTYKRPSEAEAQQMAKNYAALTVNPLRDEINRQLDAAVTQAELNKKAIEASYSSYTPQMNQMLSDAEARALENAVARGGGQSGLVEYLKGEYGKPIMNQAAQLEAEKANKLAAIDTGLAQAQQEGQKRLSELATQQGQLEAQQLANILYGKDWTEALSPAVTYALGLLGNETDLAKWVTPSGNDQLTFQTNVMNQSGYMPETNTPGNTNILGGQLTGSEEVPVRNYLSGTGASVDYDYSTGEVIINGRRYKPSKVVNGVAYMSKSDLDKAVG